DAPAGAGGGLEVAVEVVEGQDLDLDRGCRVAPAGALLRCGRRRRGGERGERGGERHQAESAWSGHVVASFGRPAEWPCRGGPAERYPLCRRAATNRAQTGASGVVGLALVQVEVAEVVAIVAVFEVVAAEVGR